MVASTSSPIRFTAPPRSLEATFDLEGLTSDGGLVWLQKADDALYVRAGDTIYPPLGERGTGTAPPRTTS